MNRRDVVRRVGAGLAALSVTNQIVAQPVPSKQRVMRIAHLTDVHMQPLVGAAKGFEKCLHHVQGMGDKPDLIINGGDAIMEAHGRGRDSVKRQWKMYQNLIRSENAMPIVNCVGNHDIWCREETHASFQDGRVANAQTLLQFHPERLACRGFR